MKTALAAVVLLSASLARAGLPARFELPKDAVEPAAVPPSAPAEGAAPEVRITSFMMDSAQSHLAELCGRVSGAGTEFSVVRVTVDPGTRHPAVYNALAGADGSFCVAVMTFDRAAEASVRALGKTASAKAAAAVGATPRH